MSLIAGWVGKSAIIPGDVRMAAAEVVRRLAHRHPKGTAAPLARSHGHGLALMLGTESGIAVAGSGESSFAVIVDGSLDNGRELASRLAASGIRVDDQDDAGILLAGWRAWGEDTLPLLRGPFAVAVLDGARGTLSLARDVFGRRPLAWTEAAETFVFATEVQALLAWPRVTRRADLDMVAEVISFGHAPPDRTCLQGVCRVPPGGLVTRHADGRVEVRRWCRDSSLSTPAERVEQYRRSPGHGPRIDDAGVAGMVRSGAGSATRAFRTDEGEAIRPGPSDLLERLTTLQLHAGEPLIVPPGALPRRMSVPRGRKVAFDSGRGALLLNDDRLAAFAAELARMRADGRTPAWWKSAFHETAPFSRDLLHHATGWLTERERMEVTGPTLAHTLLLAIPDLLGDRLEHLDGDDVLVAAGEIDFERRIPALELPLLDAAAAADRIEPVYPFLDVALVASICGLSRADRRALAHAHDDPGIVEGPLSSMHRVPDALDADLGPVRIQMADVLLSPRATERGLFRRGHAAALLASAARRNDRAGRALWAMFVIETWFRSFVDAIPPVPANEIELVPDTWVEPEAALA